VNASDLTLWITFGLVAAFVAYLGYENLTIQPKPIELLEPESNAWQKGAVARPC
jgi:hypothetical protein